MKQFSQEFKASVIERIRNGESQMGVAKSLGISCNLNSPVRVRRTSESALRRAISAPILAML